MAQTDHWNTRCFSESPIIRQLHSLTAPFADFETWPTLEDYQRAFKTRGLDITPVPQSEHIRGFEEQYEPRVFLRGELQTRTENWHDFFNAMIWLGYPNTKKVLNKLHYSQASQRPMGSNRSRLENRITLFDECGALLISDRPQLLEQVRQHQWQPLFIEHREELEAHLRCIIFGHAIYEKALNPYIGLCCQCLLVDSGQLLEQVNNQQYAAVDKYLADFWAQQQPQSDIPYFPLPLLGLPGYWPRQDPAFYANKRYFR